MADSYRCGECGHRTSWGSESEGQRAIEKHYRHDHPAVVPGGMVEFRRRWSRQRWRGPSSHRRCRGRWTGGGRRTPGFQ
ncbi:hypothetical protein CQW39_31625 [Streptomyces griseofuscus]|uniref:DUF1059 domain-containing protein n=1 Tax=Streptomyces griseofuscus TaxID=146922 RepID=A0A426S7Y5_9ACTN|nr:hypothetical protein CQW39_31625 [Streptomyces griseofuscus]RRQ86236.1 hypothetical protein CQW44_15180 [Streptomyces griseofuscus]